MVPESPPYAMGLGLLRVSELQLGTGAACWVIVSEPGPAVTVALRVEAEGLASADQAMDPFPLPEPAARNQD